MIPRVLYIITDSGTGGSEQVLLHLLQNLDRSQVQPCGVVVLKKKRDMAFLWERENVPVWEVEMNRFPTPGRLWLLSQYIANAKPDIVHAFLFHSVVSARLNHVLNRSYKLVTSPRVNYRFAPCLARGIDRVTHFVDDAVLCESESTRQYLLKELHYSPWKTITVQNGVDHKKFSLSISGRQFWRTKWGVQDHDLLVGAVGRLHSQKGFDVLLAAWAQLTAINVPIKLVIVGEGKERDQLQQQALRLGVPCLWAGGQKDMPAVYSAFDIFVQSSRYEGLSNALLEAMSVGLPVLATAVDGTVDVVQHQKNGWLVPPNDVAALSAALQQLLEIETLRNKMSENAKNTAMKMSLESMTLGTAELYKSLFPAS